MVEHDIESQHLETHRILEVVWLGCSVEVCHVGLRNTHGFQDYFVDFLFAFDSLFVAVIIDDKVED